MAFALVAGAATAVSPCVLPVLPALLSASGTGGRRRPLGVALGLSVTFFVTIVGLATVADGVGLADGTTRSLAIVVLVGFGIALAVPALAHRVEAPLARLSRMGPRSAGRGFWSGLGVGAALGFLYAPCAGPILAGVISVSAAQGATTEVAGVAAAYAVGSGLVLLLLGLGGRRLLDMVRRAGRRAVLQRVLGAVMVATAVAMAFDLDVRFQTALAEHFPAVVSNPTRALEESDAVEDRLRDVRGAPRFDADRPRIHQRATRRPRGPVSGLPRLGTAPDFTGTQRWFNTPGGQALALPDLRGRVVLVDFWTYTCINCIRTLPYVRALDERYRDDGLTVVGVHTPEFAFEKDAGNVRDAIAQNRLRYPVAQDNDYATWNAYGNQYWPAKYLVDATGAVRYAHFGEGAYGETEEAVRALLREAGADDLGRTRGVKVERPAAGLETPETYLGAARAERFLGKPPRAGTRRYRRVRARDLVPSRFALAGTWRVDAESASAVAGARIDGLVRARKVFLVLGSAGGSPRRVRVLLDGRPVGPAEAGEDVRGGTATVRGQRLYRLVALPRVQTRRLTLRFDAGVRGYAFTFG